MDAVWTEKCSGRLLSIGSVDNLADPGIAAYLDDVIVHSADADKHVDLLDKTSSFSGWDPVEGKEDDPVRGSCRLSWF